MVAVKPSKIKPEISGAAKQLWKEQPLNPEDYYHKMWFWELVDYRERVINPTIQAVMEATAAFYQISIKELLIEGRQRDVVIKRQVAMYLAKELTLKSLTEIGRRFGDRDHTTVLHAVRKIEAERHRLAHIGAAVTVIMRKFGR